MEWQILIAILIAIPVILFPAAIIWYMNPGGIFASFKAARARRTVQEQENKTTLN